MFQLRKSSITNYGHDTSVSHIYIYIHIYKHIYIHKNTYSHINIHTSVAHAFSKQALNRALNSLLRVGHVTCEYIMVHTYGVATVSRIDTIPGLFCRIFFLL